MKHWHIDQVAWDRFDPAKVDPSLIPLVKAAAMVERNGTDYAIYLNRVFADDPDFRQAADYWAEEEVQHGDALGRWAMLADPSWDYQAAFARYKAGYQIPLDADASVRGSRTGELIARCMVETGTSSYYSALGDAAEEPVLQQIARLIAADEFRHFKLFYDHMRRYLARENIGLLRRLRIALGRIGESEDDELAFAYFCGNLPADSAYSHADCIASYMAGAMAHYRPRHLERGMGMIFKAVGLKPRGRLSDLSTRLAWKMMQRRRRQYEQRAPRHAAQVRPQPRLGAAAS
ncbi:MAG: ferritin-like domain-containing protein [Proteobacteria bacterium]|nr:ferritin-like domain-containing protein [Pseudomonadota bacterium]